MMRLIREEEPPRPSTRLSGSTDALPTISQRRRVEPRKLGSLLRVELDWIVMKSLEKDRTRRYETALSLAHDVQRYLVNDVVEARPPSSWYRLGKIVQRNARAMTVAALVLASALIAVGSIGWSVRDRAVREMVAQQEENDRQRRTEDRIDSILEDVDRLIEEQEWDQALFLARRASALVADASKPAKSTVARIQSIIEDLRLAQRLDEIRMIGVVGPDGRFDAGPILKHYTSLFKRLGIDPQDRQPDDIVADLRKHRRVAVTIAAGIDNFVLSLLQTRGKSRSDYSSHAFAAVAHRLDADPTRDRLRRLLIAPRDAESKLELRQLVAEFKVDQHGPGTLILLGGLLASFDLGDIEEDVMLRAYLHHSDDF